MVGWNSKRKPKVDPEILERAKQNQQRINEHTDALRAAGYTERFWTGDRKTGKFVNVPVGKGISLDLAVLGAEAKEILDEWEDIRNGEK